MRKVFLDGLPKKGKHIDWMNAVGCDIRFEYDNHKGVLPVIDYIQKEGRGFIVTNFKNKKNVEVWIGAINKCRLGSLIGTYNLDYVYDIGCIVDNLPNGRFEILDKTRMKVGNDKKRYLKAYKYKCQICGDINEKTEDEIKRNGCAVCSGKIIKKGFNDLWTRRPDVAKLLKNSEVGYSVGLGSSYQKEVFVCPQCGYEGEQILSNVCKQGFSCKCCGDGISYPEKFVSNILKQLKVNFTNQKTFDWSKKKVYDFYIPKYNCIIETHGEQHYRYTGRGKTLKEEQENDKLKQIIAEENGIENYIIIDCRNSEMDFIKNNILNSDLVKILNFSMVNWEEADKISLQSNIKTSSEMWKNGHSIEEISKFLNVHKGTVRKYLIKGSDFEWCNYDPFEMSKMALEKMKEKNKKSVVQLSLEFEIIRGFDSLVDAGNEVGVNPSTITAALKGRTKTAGGFKWMYKEEYEKYIEEQSKEFVTI